MDCTEFEKYLLDYLDNETPASTSQAVEEHLNQCTNCRCELGAFKKTNMLIQLRNVPQPDESYWENTFDAISERMAARIVEMPINEANTNEIPDDFLLNGDSKTNWYKRLSYSISVAAMLIFIVAGYWMTDTLKENPDEEFDTVIIVEPEWRALPASQDMHVNFQPDADFSKFSGAAMGIISPVSQGLRAEAILK